MKFFGRPTTKWWSSKTFAKLNGNHLLMANIFIILEKSWKYILFHLTKLNMLLANHILYILCIFIKPNVWYLWSLKILAIKKWFPFSFAKNFTGPPFCVWLTKKLQTFSRHLFWEQPSKYCIAEFTAIFVCLLLSWSRRYSMNWSSNFDGP